MEDNKQSPLNLLCLIQYFQYVNKESSLDLLSLI